MSTKDAVREYGWRDNFSLVLSEIANNHPDDFARGEMSDGAIAMVAFDRKQPENTKQLLKEFQSAFPHVAISVQTNVGYTSVEINEAVIDIHGNVMARPGVTDAVTVFSPTDNTIQVDVSVESRDAKLSENLLTRELHRAEVATVPAPVSVEVKVFEGVKLADTESSAFHYGGEDLNSCTSGFGVRWGSSTSGERGISTAAHCPNSLTDDGKTLTYRGGHQGHFGDFQWHSGTGTESDDFYSGNSSTTEVHRRDVSSVAAAAPGSVVCVNGRTTHKSCTTVREQQVCANGACNLVGMQHHVTAGGDSGGPWFYGPVAYGIHHGYYRSWFRRRSAFSHATLMDNAIGVHVATN